MVYFRKNLLPFVLAISIFIVAYGLSRWYTWNNLHWKGPERQYFLSTVILGENGGYHTQIFPISDRTIQSTKKSIPYDKFLEKSTITSFSWGFIGQEFCRSENLGTFLVGGNLGSGNRSAWTAKIYALSATGWSVQTSLIGESLEHRFRDCQIGKIGRREVLATVTQGDGYLYLYDTLEKTSQIVHLPFIGKENNTVSTLHFVDFADLDDNGLQEIYVTSTTPEFGRFWNQTLYQEGTIYQVNFDGETGKYLNTKDIGVAGEFVKRIYPINFGGNSILLGGIEGEFSEDGSVKKPFSLYLFDAVKTSEWGSGTVSIGHSKILELPHKECKEIHAFNIFWKDRPSIQIGCDNGTFYAYSYNASNNTLKQEFRFVFGLKKMNSEYVKDRDLIQFWDIVQVHAIFGDDFDFDGKDELLVGVNNTGLYSMDFDEKTPKIQELFGISRSYPEYFGRLTIFSIDTILPKNSLSDQIFSKWMESSAKRPFE